MPTADDRPAGEREGAPTVRPRGDDRPTVEREGAPTASQWSLPKLRVARDGVWLDDGIEITHPGILANLRGNLRKDAEGYFIQTRVRIPVTVEDVPWVVERVEPRGGRLRAVLNDGTEADVDPAALRMGPGDVPYCPVKEGRFDARFSRAATFQLLALADYDERTGQGTIRLGGQVWPLMRPPLSPQP